ncbi:MAG: hypothetical protein K5923_03150 [Clostridia bacterium]|nr:hypothetical protein [Clostridia bacterium]
MKVKCKDCAQLWTIADSTDITNGFICPKCQKHRDALGVNNDEDFSPFDAFDNSTDTIECKMCGNVYDSKLEACPKCTRLTKYNIDKKKVTRENFDEISNCDLKEKDVDNGTKKQDSGLFSHIGKKIMTLAKVICWLGIIGSVIMAIVIMASGKFFDTAFEKGYVVGYGIGYGLAGCIVSWLSTWILYGFGRLIDNSDRQVELLEDIKENTK